MPASSDRPETDPAPLVLAILGILYTVAAAPGVGWRDSGELGAAAFHLGIAHPTGFPLALLAGKLACLIPLGDVAFRLNVSCGLAMAGAGALAASTAHAIVGGRGLPARAAAAVVGLGFVCAPTLLLFATVMEVYAWTALVVTASLRLLVETTRSKDPRHALIAVLLAGLSFGSHAAASLASVTCAGLAVAVSGRERRRTLVLAVPVLIAGIAVVAYLPVRSAVEPIVVWDDLSTAGALRDHLTASRIRAAFADRPGALLPWDAADLGRLALEDAGIVALLSAVPGLVAGWRGRRIGVAALAIVLSADVAYSLFVNPMGIADRQTGFVATIALLVLAGIGVATMLEHATRRSRWSGIPLAVALLVAMAVIRPADAPRSGHDGLPGIWARNAMEQVPPGSVILCTSDEMCGIGMYLGRVAGVRPDVSLVPRQHLWNDESVKLCLGRAHPSVARDLLSSSGHRLSRIVEHDDERGLFWEVGDGADLEQAFGPGRPPLDFGPGSSAPVARVGPGMAGAADIEALSSRLLAWLEISGLGEGTGRDPSDRTRRMLARDFLALGRVIYHSGDVPAAHEAFARGAVVDPGYAPLLVNMAIIEAGEGRLEEAIVHARAAVEAEPTRVKARETLGIVLMQAGRMDEGLRMMESARMLDGS